MSMKECHICFESFNKANPAYYLKHYNNIKCESVHVFDWICAQQIDRSQNRSCPFCRSNIFSVMKVKNFYEKYRISEVSPFALTPILMAGSHRIITTTFNYVSMNGLGAFIGGTTAAAFGGYTSFLATFEALTYLPPYLQWSSQAKLMNSLAILCGLSVTYAAFGFNDLGNQVGAALLTTSGILNLVFGLLDYPK